MKAIIIAVILALCACGTDEGNSVVQTDGEYGRKKIILTADPHIAPINQPVTVTALLSDRSYSGTVNFTVVQAPNEATIYIPPGTAVNGVATSTFTCPVEGLIKVRASVVNVTSNLESVYFFQAQPLGDPPIYLPEWVCVCIARLREPSIKCDQQGVTVFVVSRRGQCGENTFTRVPPPTPGTCEPLHCRNLDQWLCDFEGEGEQELRWVLVGPRLVIDPPDGCPPIQIASE